jgi:hypothetical protein
MAPKPQTETIVLHNKGANAGIFGAEARDRGVVEDEERGGERVGVRCIVGQCPDSASAAWPVTAAADVDEVPAF